MKRQQKPTPEQAELVEWLDLPVEQVSFRPGNRVTITIPGAKPQDYTYKQKLEGFTLDVSTEESSREYKETGELVTVDGRRKQSTKTALRDAAVSNASPAEVKKTLKKQGLTLSQQQQEIVRGKMNRAQVIERMAATGLKRSTLYYKAEKLTAEVEAIRTKPLPPKPSKETPPTKADNLTKRLIPPGPVFVCDISDGEDLRELDTRAAALVRADADYYHGLKWQLDQVWSGTPAGKLIHLVRWCPRVLLDAQDGPELVRGLVELLETAKCGDKDTRAAAWKELAILTKPQKGNPREFDPFGLGIIAEAYHCRVCYLQRQWKATKSKPGYMKAAALVEIRKAHRAELARFTDDDNRLQSFLLSDPLEAACRLAATATDIDAKTFKLAFAKWRRKQERDYKRATFNPYSVPSTPTKT